MSHRFVQGQPANVVGRFLSVVVPVVLITAAVAEVAPASADWEGRRTNSILLNGDWEFCPGDGSEQAESLDGASRLQWWAVTLPGPFLPWSQEAANQTKVIWARRSFKVTDAQAQGLAVLRTDLYLINDSWHDATIHVDVLLTEEDPEFIPEAACFDRPVAKWSYDFTLKADTLTKTPITWKLPEREGSYWLTARTTGIPGRPVLSQRFVRAVRPPEVPATLRERRFVVLGGDAAAEAWFPARGLRIGHGWDGLTPDKHVVVLWNAARLTADEKGRAGVLREFVSRGGRVVVLATRSWDWTELCDINVGDIRGSRAFLYPEAKPSMLAGIQTEGLRRWNGLPGTVAAGSWDGPALAAAERILWVREPKTCVAAEVPVAGGGAEEFSSRNWMSNVAWTVPSLAMTRWPRGF
jgi:hypothetical protein